MKLISDWKHIVRKAWSIRFLIIAGLLSGLEVALPFISDSFPNGVFAALSGLVVCAAFVARLVAQKDFEK